MREILFRGKTVSYGEWVYGYLNQHRGNETHDVCGEIIRGSDFYIRDWAEKIDTGFYGCDYKVKPDTVGEYTGLTDKNGKKIFEGDVVVCNQPIQGNWVDSHTVIGYVEMKHGAFGLHRKFRTTYATIDSYYRPFKDWLEDYEYEVIGNIYDNPELLEE